MNPKLSIIVPCWNSDPYLEQCLDSLLGQSLSEIEIICIDDGSDDGTGSILSAYAERDSRVVAMLYSETGSASLRRKQGVLASRGEYIMFVDSDDWLEEDACRIALDAIYAKRVDILQFGAFVDNCGGLPESRIELNQKLVDPPEVKILSGNLVERCFADKQFGFTLWNKIYRGDLVRKAASFVEEGFFPKANDLYLAFLILYFAQTYSSLETRLYHYCFGRGMTGKNVLSLSEFDRHCRGAAVYFALERFVEGQHADQLLPALETIKSNLMSEQAGKWLNDLKPVERGGGFEAISKAWSSSATATAVLANSFYKKRRLDVLDSLVSAPPSLMEYIPREIKTVALCYRGIENGGAQRVVAMLCNKLSRALTSSGQPLKVVLVTDEEPSDDDYALSDQVTRVVVPSRDRFPAESYELRAKALQDIISQYAIDAFIHSLWIAPVLPWDMMSIKAHPRRPAFIVHTHSIAAMTFRSPTTPAETMRTFSLADAVVCLSSADEWYWGNFNNRALRIDNPCALVADREERAHFGGEVLLWVGRISKEKRPKDALRIFASVRRRLQNAQMVIVGDGDEKIKEDLISFVRNEGLEDCVSFEGFQSDVAPYYRNATALLSTSEFEGQPLTLLEAASCGLPIVLYEMPYLSFCSECEGWHSAPQGDVESAADSVVELLSFDETWREASDLLFDSCKRFLDADPVEKWMDLFARLERSEATTESFSPEGQMALQQIAKFHKESLELKTRQASKARRELEKLDRQRQRSGSVWARLRRKARKALSSFGCS